MSMPDNTKRLSVLFVALIMAIFVSALFAHSASAQSSPDGAFQIVDTVTLTDGRTKAAWGHGNLHANDPFASHPQAYATTETYSGTAYSIGACVDVQDSNGGKYSSGYKYESNASRAESGTIVSKTASCTFTGHHRVKDTGSSGWQSATTSASY